MRQNAELTPQQLQRLAASLETESERLRRHAARMKKEGIATVAVSHTVTATKGLRAMAKLTNEIGYKIDDAIGLSPLTIGDKKPR